MVEINWWVVFPAGLVPMIIGFIWYNPKVLGKVWMDAAGITEEKMKGANMGLTFFLSYVFSCMLASAMLSITIHQLGMQSSLMNVEGFGVPMSQTHCSFFS